MTRQLLNFTSPAFQLLLQERVNKAPEGAKRGQETKENTRNRFGNVGALSSIAALSNPYAAPASARLLSAPWSFARAVPIETRRVAPYASPPTVSACCH